MKDQNRLLIEKLKHEKEHYEHLKHLIEELEKHLVKVANSLKNVTDVEKQAEIYENWRKARKEAFKSIRETLAQIEIHY